MPLPVPIRVLDGPQAPFEVEQLELRPYEMLPVTNLLFLDCSYVRDPLDLATTIQPPEPLRPKYLTRFERPFLV